MSEEKTYINPLEDQRREALRHYEELSSKCHHWSSFVANAIKAYNPTPAPVSVKPVQDESLVAEIIKKYIPNGIQNVKAIGKGNGKPQYKAEIDAIATCMKEYAQSLPHAAPVKPVEGEPITKPCFCENRKLGQEICDNTCVDSAQFD